LGPIFIKIIQFVLYFCLWSIWSSFCKIAFNQVLLVNGVKIINGTVTTWNCLRDVADFCTDVGTYLFRFNLGKKINCVKECVSEKIKKLGVKIKCNERKWNRIS